MRWAVATILGWTGLPAFRFLPAITPPSAPASILASDTLLVVLESVFSTGNAAPSASSRLCTPNELSLIGLGELPCAVSRSGPLIVPVGPVLPRCTLFSISFSLRRKNVVGPECPGFASGGGLTMDDFRSEGLRLESALILPVSLERMLGMCGDSGCRV